MVWIKFSSYEAVTRDRRRTLEYEVEMLTELDYQLSNH